MTRPQPVSSPISTGGGGTFFEQHVNALFLALLLVRGIPPILKDCQIEEVHLQTGHLGWSTDDVLIIGTRGAAGRRRLALQVKRRFTISSENDEAKQTFSGFWDDFMSHNRFDATRDRLALVTLRGTDVLLTSFNSLLDCARASADATDFAQRLTVPGYLSKTAKDHATAIRAIVQAHRAQTVSDDELWRFLSVLHVVSFDLNTSTAQTEALIKSLLATTSREPDASAEAEATWCALLELVGADMPAARSYVYESLPEQLRHRHAAAAIGGPLQALASHSETTLQSIQTTIAHVASVSREPLVARILEVLDESQVVVVTGPAGCGKSVLARRAIELLRSDMFCLVFRAEEFAASHIDQVLQHAQVSVNAEQLLALLAAQSRKLILVESVERLLEHSVRDAFSDLLRLAQRDGGVQVVLTCRDYSLETVRSSLLGQVTLRHSVLDVPPLADGELAEVVKAFPTLARPLANPNLKELLRSPYLLDKAARMDWSSAGALPSDERAFRLRCWREVVRHESLAGAGRPGRREQVFIELSLRRARALAPYVPCGDLDPEIMEALRSDDLVAISAENNALAAPAHDVLEDWAIVHWLGSRFSIHEQDPSALAADIGGFPAIRRGYRKWLGEILECETVTADAFVLATFRDASLPAQLRDDTLVSLLLSSSARAFVSRQSEALLADDGQLLVRLIHLLRVSCKALPQWLREGGMVPSQLLLPHGEAWQATLEVVSAGVDRLLPKNLGLLLGLLEDWVRTVEWARPEPPGFHAAGKIAFVVLSHVSGYRMDDMRKRALKVIAMIPRADADAFEDLLDRGIVQDQDDEAPSELADILLTGWMGGFACRDFPNQMVRLAMGHFCLTDDDAREASPNQSRLSIEPFFGIRDHTNHDFIPASALRGPFLPLLQHHPSIGVQFILDLLNHAGTWYGEQRWPYDPLEPAWRLTLDVPGEGQIEQWANPRLWCVFRGMSVAPYVLQCALMALESWLLGICRVENADVEGWLLKLLRETNNVAVTAVVASVSNAYPDRAGCAAPVLLSSRDLIDMDRARTVQDRGHSIMTGLLTGLGAEAEIYNAERRQSDALPHRQHDLESLAVKLQLAGRQAEVWPILDRHRAALPAVQDQTDEDRLWRLALHRMDIRGYRPMAPPPEMPTAETTGGAPVETPRVYVGPTLIEDDIRALVDEHAPVRARQEADLSLLVWGRRMWTEQSDVSDAGSWPTKLREAKERSRDSREPEGFSRGGPGFVAAVCVRDHWEEMDTDYQEWCVSTLIREIERDCDGDDGPTRHARGLLQPDRAAASVLPRVLSMAQPDRAEPRLVAAIAKALTHSVSEVVGYAAEGIGYYLQGSWRDFAWRCVGAIARQARLTEALEEEQRRRPFEDQAHRVDVIRRPIPDVRVSIGNGEFDAEREVIELNLAGWIGQISARTILQILGYWPDSSRAIDFYSRVARVLADGWNEGREGRRGRRPARSRDYHFEYEFFERAARFVLKVPTNDALTLCTPFLEAVADHPADTAKFIEFLIMEEDRRTEPTPFWEIWEASASRLCAAPWVGTLDARHSSGTALLRVIFLGLEWKEGVRQWRRLEGHAGRLDALIVRLPPSAASLAAYCRYLYQVGAMSLPDALIIVAQRLGAGNVTEMLSADDTAFCLEAVLGRYVYGEPLRLKSKTPLRSAVVVILDGLVEHGSSAAFRMRDDFVTPISKPA